jgi:nitrite reductase (cytochrome c-552)
MKKATLLLLFICVFMGATIYSYAKTDGALGIVPVDTEKCFECHNTVEKMHERGSHSGVNCSMCHTVPSEHTTFPSVENRPTVRTDHRACAQCHDAQLADMLNTEYHMSWAENGRQMGYNHVRQEDGSFAEVQSNFPRYHVGILADISVNRGGGRFAYKDGYSEVTPVENLWEAVEDLYPEDGNEMLQTRPSVAWRPHKMKGVANLASCLKCKTGDLILESSYLDDPKAGAPLQRTSKILPALKQSNSSFNCNFCHDPHSAEPRIVNDILIEALINPEYKDNEYQKDDGKTMAKVEIVNMGARGYERKIAILDRPDSNLMCGQCHISFHTYVTLKDRDTDEGGNGVTVGNLATTLFSKGPLELQEYYKKNNLYNAVHPETGIKYTKKEDHAHLEIVTQSAHGKAGVGCADCHFAKKSDGSFEHQPSLPMKKVANTCLTAACHGPGTKSNWTQPQQAIYQISAMQQKAKNQISYFRAAKNDVISYLSSEEDRGIKMTKKAYGTLANALERALTVESFWRTDYSNGFHNPELYESSVLTSLQEMTMALKEAKQAENKM